MTSICPVHKYKADNAINRVFLVDWIKGHECYLCHCLKLCLQKHTEKRSDIEQGCCIHLYDCTGVPNTCRRRSVFMAHSSVGTQWCQPCSVFHYVLFCFLFFFFITYTRNMAWHCEGEFSINVNCTLLWKAFKSISQQRDVNVNDE